MKIYGDPPGVSVGTVFANRAALHEAGVHLPLMGGISGSSTEAADSIVVSGGYEDDVDLGDVIIYTGQGGNDPSSKGQIADQKLTHGNIGLVKSMLEGRPVRVVRGWKHKSQYAPSQGFRYDGLFFVEAYWRERGRSGFLVWRYRLRQLIPTAPSSSPQDHPRPGAPSRREATISRVIRSTAVAIQVKETHGYACQACGVILQTPGGPYAEAAHIQPLGLPHNGPDCRENILCLCPNDHLLFDVGAFSIADDMSMLARPGRLRLVPGHRPGTEFLRYHREHFGF